MIPKVNEEKEGRSSCSQEKSELTQLFQANLLSHGWLLSESSATWRKSKRGLGCAELGWGDFWGTGGPEPLERRRPGPGPPAASPHLPRPRRSPSGSRGTDVARLRPAARAPDPDARPRNPGAGRGRCAGREAGGGRGGSWAAGGGDLLDVTPRRGGQQTGGRGARGGERIPGAAAEGGGAPERRPQRHPALSPRSRAAGRPALSGRRRGQRPSSSRLGARGRGRVPRGGRLGGRGRGRAPERVGGRGRGAAAPRAAPGARGPRQGLGGAMAAGSITTLPALPEDGGSGAFPPGHFKDPKRLYCKNGGFFLRIHPDGRVDGVREKSDPHIKLQLQAEERGVVSIKGVCANRYLAMKEDGRLLASKCVTDECFFFERLESNNYNTYRSRKYSSWYVALKRTGQYKLGPKTGPGQKAILFLPMSAKS
ncbi:LOW QUALITY PROTEIN: fibroblast growth factor 2 [Moschus berezovskii]|uniref:LOW QUALITY PROTEIN: fibroblast growth factor 2 n=1 Tax=Moschus berezovskii TaxID=68408 RepID=UPI0024445BA0|nr:LOW QUALITY PROTEIN: fibroblast growth factor 2 [Moschus berezovskii]